MEQLIAKLLQDFEQGKMNRRQLIQSLALAASAAAVPVSSAAGKGFKAIAVNHISYQVTDYAKTRDFYADLMGMEVLQDTGRQCNLAFGDTFLLPRNAREGNAVPRIDHVAYTVENWNQDQVEDELKRRGYKLHQSQGGGQPSPRGPMEYRPDTEYSFHILDPNGFDLQISGKEMNAHMKPPTQKKQP